MLHIVEGLEARRQINSELLGWPEESRASSEEGLMVNHHYLDMRGFTQTDAEVALLAEHDHYVELEKGGWNDDLVGQIIDDCYMDPDTFGFDFGVVGAVTALSSIGAIPVSSCNGGVLGETSHTEGWPCLLFYAKAAHVPLLMGAATAADVSMINNSEYVEVYTEDLRKLHRFGIELISRG